MSVRQLRGRDEAWQGPFERQAGSAHARPATRACPPCKPRRSLRAQPCAPHCSAVVEAGLLVVKPGPQNVHVDGVALASPSALPMASESAWKPWRAFLSSTGGSGGASFGTPRKSEKEATGPVA